jgi:hypothetical protein
VAPEAHILFFSTVDFFIKEEDYRVQQEGAGE